MASSSRVGGDFREMWTASPNAFNSGSGRSHTTQQDDELDLKYAALERLPTYDRMRKGVLRLVHDDGKVVHDEVDVTKLGLPHKKLLIDNILKVVEEDNERFLRKLRDRVDRYTYIYIYIYN